MGDGNIDPMQTLVRYNNPVLVVKHTEKPSINEAITPKDKSKRASSASALPDVKNEAEEILNLILPRRTWEENGQLWTQTVSTTPATRQDVINLQDMLDTRLKQTQARETGICPIRRELYSQCFDEIIRQITINCTERGVLLARIKDEITMSMQAYETLYCSSVAFGMRKALLSQEEKENLREQVKNLETEKHTLEETIAEMKIKNEQADKRYLELRASEEKKYAEEVAFLKKTNAQLKAQLEGITAPKK